MADTVSSYTNKLIYRTEQPASVLARGAHNKTVRSLGAEVFLVKPRLISSALTASRAARVLGTSERAVALMLVYTMIPSESMS